MSKIRNPKVVVSTNPEDPNPYKKGSFKRILMDWALTKESFTRDEFLAAHAELRAEHKIESEMTIEVAGKAWWNEFYNKHETFVDVK